MSKIFVLALAVFALLAISAQAMLSESQLRSEFGSFISTYGRNYANAQEHEERYQIFRANMIEADELNNLPNQTAVFGATKFADWTDAEKVKFLGKLPADRKRDTWGVAKPVQQKKVSTLSSFDLVSQGTVPAVANQGQCGSCWAFSATFGVASAALKNGYTPAVANNLSQQQVVDCTYNGDDGCDGGDLPDAYDAMGPSGFGGLVSGDKYPYTAKGARRCPSFLTPSDIVVPVTGFEWIIPAADRVDWTKVDTESALQKMSERKTAGAICVQATNSWFMYKSGVFNDPSCSGSYYKLNHCVGFTGYNAEDGYVTIQNSWGGDWGIEGRMNIKYDPSSPSTINQCGWASEMVFALVK
jgi:xylem cysteine proteinase